MNKTSNVATDVPQVLRHTSKKDQFSRVLPTFNPDPVLKRSFQTAKTKVKLIKLRVGCLFAK